MNIAHAIAKARWLFDKRKIIAMVQATSAEINDTITKLDRDSQLLLSIYLYRLRTHPTGTIHNSMSFCGERVNIILEANKQGVKMF